MHKRALHWRLTVRSESCPFCDSRLHNEVLAYWADSDRPLRPECHDARGPG